MNKRDEPNIAWWLAFRFLLSPRKESSIAFMTKLCFVGSFIGTFSLMLTLIVMTGFEQQIAKKIRGVNSEVSLSAPGEMLDYPATRLGLLQQQGSIISAVSGVRTLQAIISTNGLQTATFIKGVDPKNEESVSSLGTKIQPHETGRVPHTLPSVLGNGKVLLGHKIASKHNLSIGDTFTLMVPQESRKNKILLEEQDVILGGTFNIGLEEYDNNIGFCSLKQLHELFDHDTIQVDQLNIQFKPEALSKIKPSFISSLWTTVKSHLPFASHNRETELAQHLSSQLPGFSVYSWKQFYPALFASLELEKYVMAFILALITLVASMNMISLLFMQVQAKRGDIAILKTMGMPSSRIRSIFMLIGMFLITTASTAGLLIAALVGFILQNYPFITLPDVYFVTHLPAHLDALQFLTVFGITLTIGFFATWIPSRIVKNINITQVLRQE